MEIKLEKQNSTRTCAPFLLTKPRTTKPAYATRVFLETWSHWGSVSLQQLKQGQWNPRAVSAPAGVTALHRLALGVGTKRAAEKWNHGITVQFAGADDHHPCWRPASGERQQRTPGYYTRRARWSQLCKCSGFSHEAGRDSTDRQLSPATGPARLRGRIVQPEAMHSHDWKV